MQRTVVSQSTKMVLSTVFALLASFLVASQASWAQDQDAGPVAARVVDEDAKGNPYVAGELLVVYEAGLSAQEVGETNREVGALAKGTISETRTRLLSFSDVKNERARESRERALQKKKQALDRDPDVAGVSYNYLRELMWTPNDDFYAFQGGLAQIGAAQAWDKNKGTGVDIAILDTGVLASHEDLRGKIADQYDFVDHDPIAQDLTGHGTHVAGIAAASTNNVTGVAGTCPECRILAGRVHEGTPDSGWIEDYNLAEGISWAANNGAEVISVSGGGPAYSWPLMYTVDYAWQRGGVLVAASGNSGNENVEGYGVNPTMYPAGYDNVIAVGSVDHGDRLVSTSSYGDHIDVTAPGTDVMSTVPYSYEPIGYAEMSGTSMAAPHIAGVAALLKEQGLSNDAIRRRIEMTAKDLGADGKDPEHGWGRVNAAAAVGTPENEPAGMRDGIPNTKDNCKSRYNPLQTNKDADDLGDPCDPTPYGPDADGDLVLDGEDNCPSVPNRDQMQANPEHNVGIPCAAGDQLSTVYDDHGLRLYAEDQTGAPLERYGYSYRCSPGDQTDAAGYGQDHPSTYGAYGLGCYRVHKPDTSPSEYYDSLKMDVDTSSRNCTQESGTADIPRGRSVTMNLTAACSGLKIVLKDQDGRPVKGATFRISDGNHWGGIWFVTDEDYDGVLYINDLVPGTVSFMQDTTMDGCAVPEVLGWWHDNVVTVPRFEVTTVTLTNKCGPAEVLPLQGTKLTLGASPQAVTYGDTTTLSGRLTGLAGEALSNKKVVIEQRPAGTSRFTREALGGDWLFTEPLGTFRAWWVKPSINMEYRARFLSMDGEALAPATSAIRKVGVRVQVALNADTTDLRLGQSRTISGEVAPSHTGFVSVDIKRNGVLLSTQTVSLRNSKYSFSYKPSSMGTYSFTANYAGDTDHLGGISSPRSFRVIR